MTTPNPNFVEPEEKKWLLSQLDALQTSMLQELRLMNQRLTDIKNNEVNRIKGRRNNILSGLAIAITIIFGIYSVEPPELSIYIPLTIILAIGLFVYISHNLIISKIQIILSQASKDVLEHEGTINFSQSFLLGRSAILANTPYQYCFNYMVLLSLFGFVLAIRIKEIFDKTKKEKYLNKEIKSSLTVENIDLENIAKDAPNLLNLLDKNQPVPKKILDLIEQKLSKYNTDNTT